MSQRKGAWNLILETETWQRERQELGMRDRDPRDPVYQGSVEFQGFTDVSGKGKGCISQEPHSQPVFFCSYLL